MIWKKITINTNVEAADIVASVLFDNGIVGAEIEDNQNLSNEDLKKMYVDIPKVNIDDGKSKVSFYVSIGEKQDDKFKNVDKNLIDNSYMRSSDNIFSKEEFEEILDSIKSGLEDYRDFVDMGSLLIEETEMDDEIFLNKWKENFKSITIENINILPNWEKKKENMINIFIEPGNAFGTGQHETTKLCVEAINKIMAESKNEISFLDIGTGSAILAIIAEKLGAKKVVAIDVDENCELNIKTNLKLNDIDAIAKIDSSNYDSANFIYGFGNVLTDDNFREKLKSYKYDMVVANILAPVLVSLIEIGKVHEFLNDDGYLILSGIVKEKETDVLNALQKLNHYKNIECKYDGDWVAIICQNKK